MDDYLDLPGNHPLAGYLIRHPITTLGLLLALVLGVLLALVLVLLLALVLVLLSHLVSLPGHVAADCVPRWVLLQYPIGQILNGVYREGIRILVGSYN